MPINLKKQLIDEIGSDLRQLAEIISDFQLSVRADREIYRASGDLRRNDRGDDVLSIQLVNIELRIHNQQKLKPAGVELDDSLVADIILRQNLDLASTGATLDSILHNSVTFKIKGIPNRDETIPKLISAWHFDYHSYGSDHASACHPMFHWQFGGWGLKDVSDDISGVLVMDTPRLFAPPLDAVLAVDFLLSHFNGPAWQRVRSQEPRYSRMVRRSQARLWKPFFDELSDHIVNGGDSTSKHFGKLLPNIL